MDMDKLRIIELSSYGGLESEIQESTRLQFHGSQRNDASAMQSLRFVVTPLILPSMSFFPLSSLDKDATSPLSSHSSSLRCLSDCQSILV
nr:hypothetical protein Iba_chr13eCG1000 [Ipomoea batatas]